MDIRDLIYKIIGLIYLNKKIDTTMKIANRTPQKNPKAGVANTILRREEPIVITVLVTVALVLVDVGSLFCKLMLNNSSFLVP